MKGILIILLQVFVLCAIAQEEVKEEVEAHETRYNGFTYDSSYYRNHPERLKNNRFGYRNAIKFDVLRFIDYVNSTTLFSYERYIGKHWGLEASIGLMHRPFYINNRPDAWSKNRGFMTDIHLKYYFDGNDAWWESVYVGVKARYFQYSITKKFNYFSDSLFQADSLNNNGKFNAERNVGQDKWQYCIQATVGARFSDGGRFETEVQAALGFGRRSVVNRFLDPIPSDAEGPIFGTAFRLLVFNRPGVWNTMVLSLHVKLGINWGLQNGQMRML